MTSLLLFIYTSHMGVIVNVYIFLCSIHKRKEQHALESKRLMFESWLSIVNVSSWQAIQLSWASVSLLIVVQISMSQNCYKNEKKECMGQQLVPGLYRYTSSVLFYFVIMQKLELQLFIYCVSLSFLLRKEACLSKPNLDLNRKVQIWPSSFFFQHFLTV